MDMLFKHINVFLRLVRGNGVEPVRRHSHLGDVSPGAYEQASK